MKLMWFHLMPYTRLPEDFRERHNSVWVDIDRSLFDPAFAHRLYNEFMDELEDAAALGFDAICVNEHHANGYGLMPSPNLIAAALARRTRPGAEDVARRRTPRLCQATADPRRRRHPPLRRAYGAPTPR